MPTVNFQAQIDALVQDTRNNAVLPSDACVIQSLAAQLLLARQQPKKALTTCPHCRMQYEHTLPPANNNPTLMETAITRPSAQTISDPEGIRALVDRIRLTHTGPVEFVETYSDAMGVVEDFLNKKLDWEREQHRITTERLLDAHERLGELKDQEEKRSIEKPPTRGDIDGIWFAFENLKTEVERLRALVTPLN